MGKNSSDPIKYNKPQRARNTVLRAEKQRRQEEAEVRKELASKRTPEEQLAHLDRKGYVATKERAKLALRIAQRSFDIVKATENIISITHEEPKEKKGAKARRQAKKDRKAS